MKKMISLILACVLLLSFAPMVPAEEGIPVFLDEVRLDKAGVIVSDRTFLPVRALCEAVGMDVEWIDETKSVIIGNAPEKTEKSDAVNIYLDGEKMENAEAVIIDGSTYLPVRALCEALGMEVMWDEGKREVHVYRSLDYVIESVVNSEGYKLLSDREKERFITYTTNTLPIGARMCEIFENRYSEEYFAAASEEQRDMLISFLAETPYYSAVLTEIVPDGEKAGYEIVSETYNASYDVWRGNMVPVWIYSIKMESGYENVYHEWQMITTEKETSVVKDAIEAMSRFPYGSRRWVEKVVYTYASDNCYYGGGNNLWIRLSWMPDEKQIAQSFSMVMGYTIEANTDLDRTLWPKAIDEDVLPVAGYGNLNTNADMGEFSRLFHNARCIEGGLGELERLYPNRFRLFAAMLYLCDKEYYGEYKSHFEALYATDSAEGGYVTIAVPFKGLYLTYGDDGYATFEERTGGDNQLWKIDVVGENTVIRSKVNGFILFPQLFSTGYSKDRIHLDDPSRFSSYEMTGDYHNVVIDKANGEKWTVFFSKWESYLGWDENESIAVPTKTKTELLIKAQE